MSNIYLEYDHKVPSNNSLIYDFTNLFATVNNIGISDKDIERSIARTRSIASFKELILLSTNDLEEKELLLNTFYYYE